ncbi:MAG: hypothetical protein AABZ47_18720 [Planctomycetota bacterium]
MQIRFHCPTDGCVAIIEYQPLEQCAGAITCPRCKQTHRMTVTPKMHDADSVDECAVCRGTELFVRKDFPQRVGLFVVLLFGGASLYYFRSNAVLAWLILAAAVVVDFLIYLVIGKMTTCYGCRAEYRKCKLNPAHEAFDLATSEKY